MQRRQERIAIPMPSRDAVDAKRHHYPALRMMTRGSGGLGASGLGDGSTNGILRLVVKAHPLPVVVVPKAYRWELLRFHDENPAC